jgi:hypothetical protein
LNQVIFVDSSNICLIQVINYLKLIQEKFYYLILAKFFFCVPLLHNATKFVASDKKQLQHLHDDEKFHNHLATNGIIWHFVPSAPNFGEVWETVVKSMKIQLRNATLTLNDFPWFYVSSKHH